VRLIALLALVLLAFSGNSLLTRAALQGEAISGGLFSVIRLAGGALTLSALVLAKRSSPFPTRQDLWGSLALFGYVVAFSFAYVALGAGIGALVLFGVVQITTISCGKMSGERLGLLGVLGVTMAAGGLVWLLRPGTDAIPLIPALTMAIAGLSWGVYTLLGRGAGDPTERTARNFVGAAVLAIPVAVLWPGASPSGTGLLLALLSGAVTSGLGYALWYAVLPNLSALSAGASQLLVPPLTVLLAALLLAEPVTPTVIVGAMIILGGVALTFIKPAQKKAARPKERGPKS